MQGSLAGKTLPEKVNAPVQVVTKANVDAALVVGPEARRALRRPVRGDEQVSTHRRATARGRRAPQASAWRALTDPANLATWAAPIALVVLAIVFQVLNPTFLSRATCSRC